MKLVKFFTCLASIAMLAGTASAVVVTDFSNFSESGNMLNSASHDREQDFSTSGATITITDPVDGLPTVGSASQEIFGTSEFTSFTTLGYRLEVDLTTVDFQQPGTAFTERVGLVTASTVPAGGPSSADVRSAGDYFYWVYRGDPGVLQAGMYTSGGIEEEAGLISVGAIGTDITGLYMERVNDISNGDSWDLGYIDENGEDVFVQNRATINGEAITTDGSVIGIYSDMRDSSSTFVLDNLSYGFIDPADLNTDGFVDGLDLGILLGNWNQNVGPSQGELDGTQPVDGLDLGILLGAWNPPPLAAAAAVPEPTSLALLGLGSLAMLVRRRQK